MGNKIIETIFGSVIAAVAVFYYIKFGGEVTEWQALLIGFGILFGGFFVSKSLTLSFMDEIIKRVKEIWQKGKDQK